MHPRRQSGWRRLRLSLSLRPRPGRPCPEDARPVRWCSLADVSDAVDFDEHPGHLVEVAADGRAGGVRLIEAALVDIVVALEKVGVDEVNADLDHVGKGRATRSPYH